MREDAEWLPNMLQNLPGNTFRNDRPSGSKYVPNMMA
jgi:hypothetical protein